MMSVKRITPWPRVLLALRRLAVTVALGVCCGIIPSYVFGEVRVEGEPDAVNLDVRDTSVADVLAALGGAFNLQVRSAANLNQQVTGIYKGPLNRVLTRLLREYDFVYVEGAEGRLEVVVLRAHGGGPAVGPAPQNPDSRTAAATPPPPESDPVSASAGRATAAGNRPPTAIAGNVPPTDKPRQPNEPPPVIALLQATAAAQTAMANGMQGSAAVQSAMANGMASQSAASAPTANPMQPDMAALTQRAAASLEALRSSLARLPK